MLYEGGNARRRSGCDEGANFLKLTVLQRDGDLRSGHTKYHTMQEAPHPHAQPRRGVGYIVKNGAVGTYLTVVRLAGTLFFHSLSA